MLTIKTNHQPRATLAWYELTAKEQAEFDYLDTDDARDGASFVRYRGWTYDLGEFIYSRDIADLHTWDGHRPDSYFSGVVFRYVNRDCEEIICGTYFA